MDTHEKVLHVHHDAEQPVQLLLLDAVEVGDVAGEGVAAGPAGVRGGGGGCGGVWPRGVGRGVGVLPAVALAGGIGLAAGEGGGGR